MSTSSTSVPSKLAPSRKSASAKKKRKLQNNLEHTPHKLIHQDSIACVTSALFGTIETLVLPSYEKDILLDRFFKEIIKKFHFKLNTITRAKKSCGSIKQDILQRQLFSPEDVSKLEKEENDYGTDDNDLDKEEDKLEEIGQLYHETIKRRIVVGSNEVTRTLESKLQEYQNTTIQSTMEPKSNKSVILLARDIRPATIVAHIPVLAKQLKIPILILPGRASFELGKIMGVRTVSVLFLQENKKEIEQESQKMSNKMFECNRCIDSYIDFSISKSLTQTS